MSFEQPSMKSPEESKEKPDIEAILEELTNREPRGLESENGEKID